MEYTSAIKYLTSPTLGWSPPVLMSSCLNPDSFPAVYKTIQSFYNQVELGETQQDEDHDRVHGSSVIGSGGITRKRQHQRKQWLWRNVSSSFLHDLKSDLHIKTFSREWEEKVISGSATPGRAADAILSFYYKHKGGKEE